MRILFRSLPALVAVILFGPAAAWAGITGSISGIVTDPSGAVIEGAAVTATETQTGVRAEITTDSKGFYNFSSLPIGTYDIEVRASGFKAYHQKAVVVDANSAIRADVILQIGQATENVTVLSEAVHVETESTQNGEVITGRKMTTVPLNGRSYTDLLSLQPGVVPSAYGGQAPGMNDRSPSGGPAASGGSGLNSGNQSVNGQREAANGFMVNGANVVEGKSNGAAVVPNLDSIAEFRIITNNFDAEYGNYSGGQINVATKSGTNSLHGSGFEFLRNTALDARNFFNPAPGVKGDFKQNQFGGTVGGPIKRDKTFFFVDYTGFRFRPSSNNASLTTFPNKFRTGDFSQVLGPQLTVNGSPVFDAAGNPTPAIRPILEFNRDIVRHVPGLHEPDLDEMRLEFCNPISQLRHLEEFVLFLQIVGANPESVGNQPAKSAESDSREGEDRRSVFERLDPGDAERLAIAVQGALDRGDAYKQHSGERKKERFFEFAAHGVKIEFRLSDFIASPVPLQVRGVSIWPCR